MKINELLSEGFSGFSVDQSDTAWDLHYATEEALKEVEEKLRKNDILPETAIQSKLAEAAIKKLRAGLNDRGNEYNTHGTLNVAMILNEKFKQFRRFPAWKQFAAEIAAKLTDELKTRGKGEYSNEMRKLSVKLEKLSK